MVDISVIISIVYVYVIDRHRIRQGRIDRLVVSKKEEKHKVRGIFLDTNISLFLFIFLSAPTASLQQYIIQNSFILHYFTDYLPCHPLTMSHYLSSICDCSFRQTLLSGYILSRAILCEIDPSTNRLSIR